MSPHIGRFKDPHNPASRLYAEVLSTRSNLHYVKVTRRNARNIEPYTEIVPVDEFTTLSHPDSSEFITDSGANKGYWRQQLRGKDGRFIEMGGGIEWIDSEGKRRVGIVDGFDDEIERVIVKDSDGNEYKLSADEIKQSAVKAVLPTDEDETDSPTPPDDAPDGPPAEGEESGIDFDELLTSLDNEPVNIDEFLGDESKFPVGGPPLEIKDKQGQPVARLHKQKDENGHFNIILELLVALLPHELSRILRGTAKPPR